MWRYLQYFEVAAEEQHFGKAALRLHVSQSALSKSIDSLEQRLGFPLFEKTGRNVQLTRYGKIMYDHVHEATHIVEEGVERVRAITDPESGTLRFSSIYTLGASVVPRMLAEFLRQYPRVQLMYTQRSTDRILRDVLADNIDIGFCGEYDTADPAYANLRRIAILDEELFLWTKPNHPLAKRGEVAYQEIINENIIGWAPTTGIAASIDNTLKRVGIVDRPNQRFFVTEDNTMAEMVRQDLGLGIMTDSPNVNKDDLVRLRLCRPAMRRTIYAVWKSADYYPPLFNRFLNYVDLRSWEKDS